MGRQTNGEYLDPIIHVQKEQVDELRDEDVLGRIVFVSRIFEPGELRKTRCGENVGQQNCENTGERGREQPERETEREGTVFAHE